MKSDEEESREKHKNQKRGKKLFKSDRTRRGLLRDTRRRTKAKCSYAKNIATSKSSQF